VNIPLVEEKHWNDLLQNLQMYRCGSTPYQEDYDLVIEQVSQNITNIRDEIGLLKKTASYDEEKKNYPVLENDTLRTLSKSLEILSDFDEMSKKCLNINISSEPFIAYADALQSQTMTLRVVLLRAISYQLTDTLIKNYCRLLAFRVFIHRSEHIRNLLDSNLPKEKKQSLIASCILHTDAIQSICELEFLFGGKLTFHNVHHSVEVATNTALLMKGVSLAALDCEKDEMEQGQASAQSLLLSAAFKHDIRMAYTSPDDVVRKTGSATDASEGLSGLVFVSVIRNACADVKKEFPKEISSLFAGKEHIINEKQLKQAVEGINRTTPGFSLIPGRGGVVINWGELTIKRGCVSKLSAPAPLDEDEIKSLIKWIDLSPEKRKEEAPQKIKNLVSEMRSKPELISDLLDIFNSGIAIPISDLGNLFVAPKHWAEDITSTVKVEMNRVLTQCLELVGKEGANAFNNFTDEQKREFRESVKGYVEFLYTQEFFVSSRAAIMELNHYYPLLALQAVLFEILETKQKLPVTWTETHAQQAHRRVSQFIKRFESLFCDPDSLHANGIGVLKREAADEVLARCRQLINGKDVSKLSTESDTDDAEYIAISQDFIRKIQKHSGSPEIVSDARWRIFTDESSNTALFPYYHRKIEVKKSTKMEAPSSVSSFMVRSREED
jgi:hypothetical protein